MPSATPATRPAWHARRPSWTRPSPLPPKARRAAGEHRQRQGQVQRRLRRARPRPGPRPHGRGGAVRRRAARTPAKKPSSAASPEVSWHVMGDGFTWDTQNRGRRTSPAPGKAGSRPAPSCATRTSGIVVLDELNIVLKYGYLDLADVLAELHARPAHQHVDRHRPRRPRGADRGWPTPSPTWASSSTPSRPASPPRPVWSFKRALSSGAALLTAAPGQPKTT